jgi:hypothetical protein
VTADAEKLLQAQTDLAHVTPRLSPYSRLRATGSAPGLCELCRYLEPRELQALCLGFLESEEPLSTRELGQRVLTHSGMDTRDKVLSHTVTNGLIYVMRTLEKREGKKGWDAGRCVCLGQAREMTRCH